MRLLLAYIAVRFLDDSLIPVAGTLLTDKIVPDTSVLIDRHLSELIERHELGGATIIIPTVVIDELQAQASTGREIGFKGLEELKKLREVAKEGQVSLQLSGRRPSLEEIQLAKKGRLDALIRDVARENGALLLTADFVQALVAEVEGVRVRYVPPKNLVNATRIEEFFTPDTMSVHLKEKVQPLAKRGKPGAWNLVRIREEPCTADELEAMNRDILQRIRELPDSFVELWYKGATVIQMGQYRIAIAKPPFADGYEITIVRPITKVNLDEYKLSEKLKQRLKERAEGILVCGPPGAGKSTFATALAEFERVEKNSIVKTMESPRDLQVTDEITQYGALEGDFKKTADILLLVRPDYVIYDELRKTTDFHVFADMRLAGVGMIGVVHATDAINAVQRFIGRVELGMIPHLIDTIIFIRDGQIKKVYTLELTVKVPQGMSEADLARPVIEVRDFETETPEYEIYTYGEENVVIPIKSTEDRNPIHVLAEKSILEQVRKFDSDAQVQVVSDSSAIVRVRKDVVPLIIGKEGKTVTALEQRLGLHIEIQPLSAKEDGEEIQFQVAENSTHITFDFERQYAYSPVEIYIEGDFVLSAMVDKKGRLKIGKKSHIGRSFSQAFADRKKVHVYVRR